MAVIKQDNSTHHFERIALSKDVTTTEKIDKYYALPRALTTILESSPKEINNLSDAKLYLLGNLPEIRSILDANQTIDSAYDAIEQFVKYWLTSKKSITRLSFNERCSIKQDSTQVWLPDIGSLSISDSKNLSKIRLENWRRYIDKFDIISVSKGYFIEIPYIPKYKVVKSSDISENVTRHGKGLRVNSLYKSLEAHQEQLARIAASFTKTDYGKLDGHCVQGGLPSLGKKS